MSKARIWPPEWKGYRDPKTGVKIRQLTNYKGHSHHLYFTNPGWYDHDQRLLFGSDRENRANLFSIDLETGHNHSNDFSLIVGDGGSIVRIWQWDGKRLDGPCVLCEHRSSFHIQKVHVHPRFSPDGNHVLFTVNPYRIRFIEGWTTGCAFVVYASDGSRQFIFHLAHSAAGLLGEDDPGYFKDVKLLHIMGSALSVFESSREACYKAIKLTKDRGGLVSFDPNLRPELLPIDRIKETCRPVKEAADIILPSGEEASMLTDIEDPEDACREILSSAKTVGLKLGARGSKVFTKDQEAKVGEVQRWVIKGHCI